MKWKLVSFLVILLLIAGISFKVFYPEKNNKSFQVDSVFLKTAIKSGGSFNGKIRVLNSDENAENFGIKIRDLEDLISLEPGSFSLKPNEAKEVSIIFSNTKKKPEGVYVGNIEISNSKEKIMVPVILEVESEDILFDSNLAVFPSGDIKPGDQISAEIKIFDLSKIGSASVEMNYFIKDFEGKTIFSESENLAVKDQVLITKYFSLPENTKEGDYVLGLSINHKNSVGTSSRFFRVAESRFKFSLYSPVFIYAMVIFLALVFLILVFVFYSVYSRDKLLEELKKQYRQELKRQEEYLRKKEGENERLLKTEIEKKLNKRLFREVKEKRKTQIEKIQKKREEKLKKIKRKKTKNWKAEMVKQIERWRKQGYKTEIFEEKVKIPSVNDIKKQVNEWKKKGYNTKVLEEKI